MGSTNGAVQNLYSSFYAEVCRGVWPRQNHAAPGTPLGPGRVFATEFSGWLKASHLNSDSPFYSSSSSSLNYRPFLAFAFSPLIGYFFFLAKLSTLFHHHKLIYPTISTISLSLFLFFGLPSSNESNFSREPMWR